MSTPPTPGSAGAHGTRGDSTKNGSEAELLSRHGIVRLRAPNPGPLTLSGTNTWLVGSCPTWVVDPGPSLDAHLASLLEAIDAHGGLGGVVLTHDHADHSEAVEAVLARHPAPLAAGRGRAEVRLHEGASFGPFEAVATPGHATDHFALVADGACFTGDAVLGEGSVFVSPYPGAMAAYLLALTRLRLRDDFSIICPGHGPPVRDAHAKLDEYLNHRKDRENRLIMALGEGRRTVGELLDAVWSDVPEGLRSAAAVTLAAHLDKLEEEQMLPAGVERPNLEHAHW